MLQFFHEKMYLIIHGGDLLRHDHSNLIIGTSINLKYSDSNEFNLQDSCVWIVASSSLFCFFYLSLLQPILSLQRTVIFLVYGWTVTFGEIIDYQR